MKCFNKDIDIWNRLKRSLVRYFSCMCAKWFQSCPILCDPVDYSHQATLSMGFSRQEYQNWSPCRPLGDLPDPGNRPASPMSPALVGRFFTISATWEAVVNLQPPSNTLSCFKPLFQPGPYPGKWSPDYVWPTPSNLPVLWLTVTITSAKFSPSIQLTQSQELYLVISTGSIHIQ